MIQRWNVLFDFGNVLYDFDYGRFFRAVAPYSRASADQLRALLFEGDPTMAYRFETGAVEPDDFIRWYKETGGIDLPDETVKRSFVDIFTPHEPGLAVARECAATTRIGLISNTNKLHFDSYMGRLPLLETFSTIVLSYEVGEMKPHRALFQRAVDELECRPEDCVFVDDLEENVAGARDFGMAGIHYLPDVDLRAELGRLGRLGR
jgi:glucose-1-phosphatase